MVDATAVGGALAAVWEHLTGGIPAGWAERRPGAIAAVTGVGLPTLNGVWAYGKEAGSAAVLELLDLVVASGVAHCVQLSPRCRPEVRDVLRRRGMQLEIEIPLMALTGSSDLAEVDPGQLTIATLSPEEAEIHADLAAAGFQAPVDEFRRLMTPAVLARPGVCTYVGKLDGEPVATGIGVRLDDHVAIFNIATLAAHRRRGYGAAITARAVRDGLDSGADWAWLQSTNEGFRIYEKLGFRTVESWECWIAV